MRIPVTQAPPLERKQNTYIPTPLRRLGSILVNTGVPVIFSVYLQSSIALTAEDEPGSFRWLAFSSMGKTYLVCSPTIPICDAFIASLRMGLYTT